MVLVCRIENLKNLRMIIGIEFNGNNINVTLFVFICLRSGIKIMITIKVNL